MKVKRSGPYPRVEADAFAVGVVSQGGGVALVEAVRAGAVDKGLSSPWCNPMAIHDPAKVVIDLAVAPTLGGDCLADVAVLRTESAVLDRCL